MVGWKKNIIRLISIIGWCSIFVGATVLLVAAIQKKSEQHCNSYEIEIRGTENELFIDKKKIEEILFVNEKPIGRPISALNLRVMERKLEANVWIKDAELFLDNNGTLEIKVRERQPIARVFTIAGNSFYIDSSGERLPLSENQVAHLLVFTDFPVEKGRLKTRDSLLMRDMIKLTSYINKKAFWSAQIEQIDITANRTFELAPLVGNNIIVFGGANDLEEKFERLSIFYKEILAKRGFDHYEKLDVQYDGQIVATKNNAALSKQDSLLAIQKVKELIAEARQIEPDTTMQRNVRPIEKSEVNEQDLSNYDLLPVNADTALAETPGNPNPLKTFFEKSAPKNIVKKPSVPVKQSKENKPKAEMEKRGF